MASVSSVSSLAGPEIVPEIVLEPNRLVIKRAVTNTKAVAYDIFITFQSGGRDVEPPANLSHSMNLAHDVSALAQRILNSLPQNIGGENLEKLGFLISNTADESNPETAILVSNTVKPVMDSWKLNEASEYRRIDRPVDIALQYEGSEPEGQSKPLNVHDGLIELRSYFRAERFVAMPPSVKKREEAGLSVSPSLPNTAVSFKPSSESPEPLPPPRKRKALRRRLNVVSEGDNALLERLKTERKRHLERSVN